MPQPDRRTRLDGYGRPLPELAAVAPEDLVTHTTNRRELALFQEMLEELFRSVLRRGWHGSGHISFRVEDGILQADFTSGVERKWRESRESL